MGGVRICAKGSSPWWGYTPEQFTGANGSSPTPAGHEGTSIGTSVGSDKLGTVNVCDSVWVGEGGGEKERRGRSKKLDWYVK